MPVLIVIEADPTKTHRAVEALRIALGLSTANPVQVALLDGSPRLLSEDNEDIIDLDILEQHLPAIPDMDVEFLVPPGTQQEYGIPTEYRIREVPNSALTSLLASSERALVF